MLDSEDQTGRPGALAAVADLVRAVGGALLAFAAVLALVVLTWAKLGDLAPGARGQAFVAVVGAISTIVGGYIGVKVGEIGKQEAAQGRTKAEQGRAEAEHAKDVAKGDVAILLGKLPEGEAETVRRKELGSL